MINTISDINTRTNKPNFFRRGAVKGAAYELPNASRGLRDVNGRFNLDGANGPTPIIRQGLRALYFDGSNDYYANNGIADQITSTQNGTIWLALVNQNTASANRELVTMRDGSLRFYLYISSGVINYGWYTTTTISTGVSLAIDEFAVLSMSWTPAGCKIWLNGRVIATNVTGPAAGTMDEFAIGAWCGAPGNGSFRMDADLISCRILRYSLSTAEQRAWAEDIWHPYREPQVVFTPEVVGVVSANDEYYKTLLSMGDL